MKIKSIFTDETLDEALAHFDSLLAAFPNEPAEKTHSIRMARNVVAREMARREKQRDYWFKREQDPAYREQVLAKREAQARARKAESAREGQAGQVSA